MMGLFYGQCRNEICPQHKETLNCLQATHAVFMCVSEFYYNKVDCLYILTLHVLFLLIHVALFTFKSERKP